MENYIILPTKIARNVKLSGNEKLLLGEIFSLSRSTGQCYASNAFFAKILNTSISSVGRWIANLKKHGFISCSFIYGENHKNIEKRLITIEDTSIFITDNTPIKVHDTTSIVKNELDNSIKSNNIKLNNLTLPTKIDIEDFIKDNALNVNSKKFFDYYNKHGFLYHGQAIDWKNKLFEWSLKEKPTKKVEQIKPEEEVELAQWEIDFLKELNSLQNV